MDMEIPYPQNTSCLVSDTINSAYTGWMRGDMIKSYNLATLAFWRIENYHLWVTADEERFLTIAMKHPPHIV
jgi:hypothetical protein